MDIGYASQRVLENVILNARTLFWSGPLGVWEIEPFGEGTRAAALVLARSGQHLAGIISGDSLTAALRQFDLWTGPLADMGAPSQPVLRFLSGQVLPGVRRCGDLPRGRRTNPRDSSSWWMPPGRSKRSGIRLLCSRPPELRSICSWWTSPGVKESRDSEPL